MSAAAARRRKQLQKKAESGGDQTSMVRKQLDDLLAPAEVDESTAYEALQLAQSLVRKTHEPELAYATSLKLLERNRVAVAGQLLTLLVQVLVERNVAETDDWLERIEKLAEAHAAAMDKTSDSLPPAEVLRLQRLQREWLRQCVTQWSASDTLSTVRYGNTRLHRLLATHCWKLADLEATLPSGVHGYGGEEDDDDEDDDWEMDMRCDAIQYMCLAERPDEIVEWLKTLPPPTEEEIKAGHTCFPAMRDALFTRAVIIFAAFENLRDANVLARRYMSDVETRSVDDLKKSYTNKEDGFAPSHLMFACMLLRTCEKDARTGPLYSWLMRSFKRELEFLHKPQVVLGYTTKIGKLYFNIQPPPTMGNMLENMMNMMGGAGGGAPGGMNPALAQMMAQMQAGGGF